MHDRVILIPWLTHAGPGNTLKQPLDLLSTMGEVVGPEVVSWVLDQLNESDEQAPWVWSVHNQPFQQDPCNLLLDDFLQMMT